MVKRLKYLLLCLWAILLSACAGKGDAVGEGNDSIPDSLAAPVTKIDSAFINQLTNDQIDSLEFRLTHHYTINDNFKVLADSIKLVPREDEQSDTAYAIRD